MTLLDTIVLSSTSLIVLPLSRASLDDGVESWRLAQEEFFKDDDDSKPARSSKRDKLLHTSSSDLDEKACDTMKGQRSSEDAASKVNESHTQSCEGTQIESGSASDRLCKRTYSLIEKERRAREHGSVQGLSKAQPGLVLSLDTSAEGTHSTDPKFEALLEDRGLRVNPVCPPPAKAPKAKIGYLDLPGEIRNKIIDFALVPGHIYFFTKSQPISYKNAPVFLPGCQLLATCKQAYNEGYVSFYNRNVFHFAPGPILASMEYFWSLKRKHLKLIEKISIEMSVTDLTPSVLETIETAFYQNQRQSIAHADNFLVVRYVMDALRDLWTEKNAMARDAKQFNTIALWGMFLIQARQNSQMGSYQAPFKGVMLEGNGINKLLSFVNPNKDCRKWGEDLGQWGYDEYYKGWDDRLTLLFRRTVSFIKSTILEKLDAKLDANVDANQDANCAWEQLKEWLSNLEMTTRIPNFVTSNKPTWYDKIE